MMKYLLIVGLALLVLWLLRRARTQVRPPDRPAPPPVGAPTEIVACAHCGVHLPRADAVSGARGLPYCGAAHQREAEGG